MRSNPDDDDGGSKDGYSWDYAGTILDAAGVPQSEEGPNQNDVVLLADNKTLLCVMRIDSGEGPTMRYEPLVRSFSSDWGATWTAAESFGAGTAHCPAPPAFLLSREDPDGWCYVCPRCQARQCSSRGFRL